MSRRGLNGGTMDGLAQGDYMERTTLTGCSYGEIGSIPKQFGGTEIISVPISLLFMLFLCTSYTYLY